MELLLKIGLNFRFINVRLMDLFFIVFASILFVFSLLLLVRKDNRLPPGPFELPLIGSVGLYWVPMNGMMKYFFRLARQYGPIMTVKMGRLRFVLLNNAATINEAFVKMADVFSDRPTVSRDIVLLRNAFGDGIISSSGALTKVMRQLTLATMRDVSVNTSTLEQRIVEETEFLIAAIEADDGQPQHYTTLIQNAVSNVTCIILFSRRFDYDDVHFRQILTAVQTQFMTDPVGVLDLLLPAWLIHSKAWLAVDPTIAQAQKLLQTYSQFLKELIDERRHSFDVHNVRDFIDLFLKEELYTKHRDNTHQQRLYKEGNIMSAMIDLFLAGTETTSKTLMWVLAYLLNYPAALHQVQTEIDQVVGTERAPSLLDRPNMPYTEAVLHEVQRICNIAPTSLEHVVNRDAVVGGCLVPKGCIVFANFYNLHMDPTVWSEPHEFRPERWLNAAGKFQRLESFMPFSAGRRVCLGEQLARMELFLFFTSLVQRVDFESGQPNGAPPDLEFVEGFTLSPKPFAMKARRR